MLGVCQEAVGVEMDAMNSHSDHKATLTPKSMVLTRALSRHGALFAYLQF